MEQEFDQMFNMSLCCPVLDCCHFMSPLPHYSAFIVRQPPDWWAVQLEQVYVFKLDHLLFFSLCISITCSCISCIRENKSHFSLIQHVSMYISLHTSHPIVSGKNYLWLDEKWVPRTGQKKRHP